MQTSSILPSFKLPWQSGFGKNTTGTRDTPRAQLGHDITCHLLGVVVGGWCIISSMAWDMATGLTTSNPGVIMQQALQPQKQKGRKCWKPRGFLELTALAKICLFKNTANRKAGVTLLGEKKQGLQDAFHQNICTATAKSWTVHGTYPKHSKTSMKNLHFKMPASISDIMNQEQLTCPYFQAKQHRHRHHIAQRCPSRLQPLIT